MPDEKIDRILRSGAGKQWDPEVIDAFFRAREDIRRIAEGEEDQTAVELPGRV
jgi:response regulator RpfG family c-di-GMP phosphodiesterase